MRIEGKIRIPRGVKNKHWGIEIPILGVYTEGRTQADAYAMVVDAIESLVNRRGFKIQVTPTGKSTFEISANNVSVFIAFVLSRIRMTERVTARDAAKRLKSKSPNAFARYEQGKAIPTLLKLEDLLHAVNPKIDIVIRKRVA